jgi:hypothetical protein
MQLQYVSLMAKNPPRNIKDWSSFALEHGCNTDMKFYDSIYKDLALFSNGITQEMLSLTKISKFSSMATTNRYRSHLSVQLNSYSQDF